MTAWRRGRELIYLFLGPGGMGPVLSGGISILGILWALFLPLVPPLPFDGWMEGGWRRKEAYNWVEEDFTCHGGIYHCDCLEEAGVGGGRRKERRLCQPGEVPACCLGSAWRWAWTASGGSGRSSWRLLCLEGWKEFPSLGKEGVHLMEEGGLEGGLPCLPGLENSSSSGSPACTVGVSLLPFLFLYSLHILFCILRGVASGIDAAA
jgi:hypothetical protein